MTEKRSAGAAEMESIKNPKSLIRGNDIYVGMICGLSTGAVFVCHAMEDSQLMKWIQTT